MNPILEWQEKHRTKLTIIALSLMAIFILVVFVGIGGGDEQLSEANSVEDAKSIVDNLINSWDEQYNDLCDGPRNGTTKEKFAELAISVGEINGVGEECELLDGELQMEVQEYAREQFKKFSHLEELSDYGTIQCW